MKDAIIYAIFLPAFTSEGTLAAAKERLPVIKSLGANVIWLMPIYENGETINELNAGYDITDFFKVHPQLGTLADFQAFLQEAHGLGIRVILDSTHIAQLFNFDLRRTKAGAALLFTIPGVPLIHAGQEVGETSRRGKINWSRTGAERIFEFYQRLIAIRNTFSTLSSIGNFQVELSPWQASVLILADSVINLVTSVQELELLQIPAHFELFQNFPNPFNPSTSIRFEVPETTHLTLQIYNVLGQKIKTVIDGEEPAGEYVIQWNGKDELGRETASGLYILMLVAGSFVKSMKMVKLK
ncbi:MAG: alpha-amylase family glycosyl hydrolase [bacterium]